MRSKATSWPAVSTTATAIGRFCLRASAMPAASALRACSFVTFGPYCGTCARTDPASTHSSAPSMSVNVMFFIGVS